MYQIIGFMLLCSTLSNAFPFPDTPTEIPITPVPTSFPITPVPSPFPFGPTSSPLAPGFNNPYYNYGGGPAVPILSYSSERGLDGSYAFSFSTADGKQAQESGFLKDAFIDNAGEPQGTQVVQGSYAYIAPDGTPIQMSYIADENGFRSSGVHFPANGKAVIPALDKDNKQIIDPVYNRYNPFTNGNRFLGPYNNGRIYDPRFPYDPTRVNPALNNYNNPFPIVPTPTPTPEKVEADKDSA